MSRILTVVLSDGTSLRATATVKPGLPLTLAPGAAAKLPPTGGAGFTLAIGSSRQVILVSQTDWKFLTDRAGRLPLDQLRGSRAGALFLNVSGNPRSEIQRFLRHIELVESDSHGRIGSFTIAGNESPGPVDRHSAPRPGSHILPSQTNVLIAGRSQPRDSSPGGQTWTVFNAYAVKYPPSGSGAMPRERIAVSYSYFNNAPIGGGAAPAEEITLTFTEIRWSPQGG